MKKNLIITQARMLVFGTILLLATSASGQICGATTSNSCTFGDYFSYVKIKNSSGAYIEFGNLDCSNTSGTNKTLTSGATLDITPGENLEITITNTPVYPEYAGVWLDLNRDNSFSTSECLSGPTGPIGQIGQSATKTTIVPVPCGSNASGTAILRIRCIYGSGWNTGSGCGNLATYGTVLDFEVNLKKVNPPVADFKVPTGPNYVKTGIIFNSTEPNTAMTQLWTFYSGTSIQGSGPKGKGSWSSPGTYDVKLYQAYCNMYDSITKQVKIVSPTVAPVADFIASSNQVEIYFNVQLFDLSSNGAYLWAWEVTSPSGTVYTFSTQNPTFTVDEIGKWSVCLTSSNDVGPSTKVCKTKYIECTPPGEFYMGPNHLATNQKGILYDNGGPTLNYGNNRKPSIDYFEILPCGAKEIRLSFKSLKLADVNDKMMIYDGIDASGKLLTPASGINGTNQTSYRSQVFKATSGAMYITFQSDANGNDSGFIAVWESDLLPPQKPTSSWTTPYNPAANGMQVEFTQNIKNAQGNIDYEWILDGNPGMGTNPTFDYTFTTDGSYQVCLRAGTCNGDDTFCSNITIVTPSAPGALDYVADNLRPNSGDIVSITTTTDFANTFDWSIFPTSFQYVNGTSSSSENPQVKFTGCGPYTFTLKAWNSVSGQAVTEKKVIKNKYVISLCYCIPPVDLLSSDVGITNVNLSYKGNSLIDNESTAGDVAYTDYSGTIGATLTYGASYDLTVLRKTNSNNVNYKAWIDFNIDGDFDDPGEEILNSGVIAGLSASSTFMVPDITQSFEGKTRLRVGAAYGSFSNTPCGVNSVGEFEDYGITLANDNKIPVITLIGSDTVRVEKGPSAASCYSEVAYKGFDSTEGDLTANVVVTTDLDCTVPGIYTFDFNLKDASGNPAVPKRRTVIVVLDKTPPVLTLNGVTPMTVEQCGTFTDPGAVATDLVDGNLTTAIIVTGSVNTSAVGSYTLTYTVSDAQGNTASKTRVVNVVDTKKPGIYKVGVRIVNNAVVNIQIKSVFVDDIYADDYCNGSIPITKTPGFNGPVDVNTRATYPVSYYATDPSGNKADEDGYTINYRVDDYIAPTIELNTDDTIIHDVNDPYYSRSVTVADNYYPLSKVSLTKTGIVDPYTLGLYTEVYVATDESGNTFTKTRYIKVVDRVAPTMVAPAISTCIGQPFWAMSGVLVQDNYYSVATLLPLVKVVNHNVNIWEAGMYYINYSLTDPSGNEAATVTRTVYVEYAPNCQNTYTGVEKLKLSEAVTMYPNPTNNVLNLSYSLGNTKAISIEVFNALGSKLKEVSIDKGGAGKYSISLGEYGTGTYLIRITNNGETLTKRVAVVR